MDKRTIASSDNQESGLAPHGILEANYEDMLDSSLAISELCRSDGITYHTFYQGDLSIVDVAVGQEQYGIVVTLPIDEMKRGGKPPMSKHQQPKAQNQDCIVETDGQSQDY